MKNNNNTIPPLQQKSRPCDWSESPGVTEGFSTDLGSGKSPGTRTCDKLKLKPVQVTASNSDFARDHHRETSFFVIPTPDPTPDPRPPTKRGVYLREKYNKYV